MSRIAEPTRLPVCTYRLQLHQKFGFPDLDRIGITDCYVSPVLAAKPGTIHGYDVVNPTVLNPELGTDEEFLHLARHLQDRGMGLIVDVVPNHMCISDAKNVVAFARGFGPQLAIAVAGRFYAKIGIPGVWNGSELMMPRGLAGATYRDVFTRRILKPEERQGRSILRLSEVLPCCPVALLGKI